MKTIWGENLDRDNVLPEYPRPQLKRDSYLNLNGIWRYAFTNGALPEKWDGDILVPFSPESELSGVDRTLKPEQTLWYARRVVLPEGFDCGRVLLHFGAVDQEAEVYVEDTLVCMHTGGYLPFSADITRALYKNTAAKPGQELEFTLTVKVRDATDELPHARGKQKRKPGGIWYTPQSGIWQTVWLESVPEAYIQGLRITPLFDESAVEVVVESDDDMLCTVRVGDIVATARANQPARISMLGFTPWSPELPHLYTLRVRMGNDSVESYFAMRKFEVQPDAEGVMRLFLNGRPYFHTGVLDQGYWPDGLYTAPSDEAMIFDIQTMKDMGFNTLRKHCKVEPLRWYYHCDRLGMLVWQDVVNGGGKYRFSTVTLPVFLTKKQLADDDYARFARTDEAGRKEYVRGMYEMLDLLYSCPSIALWTAFNEGWGQFDAARVYTALHEADPTRIVDHASGWYDQGVGEVCSRHVYFKPYRYAPDALGRAVLLSEFGGYGLRVPEHTHKARAFFYKSHKTQEALLLAFTTLYEKEILPARAAGLSAAIYTQLSDVEGECNGLLSYDRKVVKLPVEAVRACNESLTIGE